MKHKEFSERCRLAVKSVPRGRVTTYAAIARALHSRAYRAVGTAMRNNRDPSVPCHRVVRSDGMVGGYNRGKETKVRILRGEGIKVVDGRIDLTVYAFKPL
ncbi:MAG: MGMT family protein [Candidatus Micrarchaeota archaeon]|nr:MGMT family protein [Candidatus Micrarchaeota archaeon]